jgi:tellurite resistance protein
VARRAPGSGATRPVLSLNLFAMPLGLAGLGGAWTDLAGVSNGAFWVDQVLYGLSATLWVIFTVTYLALGVRTSGTFRADLHHPAIGPSAAYIPVVGILLATHYGPSLPVVGPWLIAFFVAALAVVSAQLVTHWLVGGLRIESLHPGYFLPVVAGPFIASIGLSSVKLSGAAEAAFGVGAFFWLVIGTLVMGRLMLRGQLPEAQRPLMAVLLAPPATGGIAWFLINGGHGDLVASAFAGIVVIMLLIQVILVREYRRIPFSLTFWAFSFPAASTANFTVRWLESANFAGWQVYAWIAVGLATLLIAALAVATVITVLRQRVGRATRRTTNASQ